MYKALALTALAVPALAQDGAPTGACQACAVGLLGIMTACGCDSNGQNCDGSITDTGGAYATFQTCVTNAENSESGSCGSYNLFAAFEETSLCSTFASGGSSSNDGGSSSNDGSGDGPSLSLGCVQACGTEFFAVSSAIQECEADSSTVVPYTAFETCFDNADACANDQSVFDFGGIPASYDIDANFCQLMASGGSASAGSGDGSEDGPCGSPPDIPSCVQSGCLEQLGPLMSDSVELQEMCGVYRALGTCLNGLADCSVPSAVTRFQQCSAYQVCSLYPEVIEITVLDLAMTFDGITEDDLSYLEQDVANSYGVDVSQVEATIVTERRRRTAVNVNFKIRVLDADEVATVKASIASTPPTFPVLQAANPDAVVPESIPTVTESLEDYTVPNGPDPDASSAPVVAAGTSALLAVLAFL